jgi:hypothetical protein
MKSIVECIRPCETRPCQPSLKPGAWGEGIYASSDAQAIASKQTVINL